jgi:hypothetical protein
MVFGPILLSGFLDWFERFETTIKLGGDSPFCFVNPHYYTGTSQEDG